MRTAWVPKVQLALSVWSLALDSELTLDNDASAIVPSGATRRYGVELGSYYRLDEALRPKLGSVAERPALNLTAASR